MDSSRFSDEKAWDGRDLVVVAKGLEFWTDLAGVEEVDGHLLVLGDLVECWCKAVAVRAGATSDEKDVSVFGGQNALCLLHVYAGKVLNVILKVHGIRSKGP